MLGSFSQNESHPRYGLFDIVETNPRHVVRVRGPSHGPQAGGYWVPATGSPSRKRDGVPLAGTTGGEGLRVGKDIVGSQIGKDAGGAARPRPPRCGTGPGRAYDRRPGAAAPGLE